jgi:hypothetical protein
MKKALVFGLVVLMAVVFAAPAMAHEGRRVGDYEISVGWRAEPAFVGLVNGPEVLITSHDDRTDSPELQAQLEALEVDLQVTVMFGDEEITLALEPASPLYTTYETSGYVHYVADLIPMLPGDYQFQVTGTIGDVEVDELFDSADGTFSSIAPITDFMFPSAASADIATLLARIAELEARIAELEAAGS